MVMFSSDITFFYSTLMSIKIAVKHGWLELVSQTFGLDLNRICGFFCAV